METVNPKKCAQCGATAGTDALFCGRCGQPFNQKTTAPAVSVPLNGMLTQSAAGSFSQEEPFSAAIVPASRLKNLLMFMVNPGGALKERLENIPYPLALAVSGLAFALFFLQTGLDLVHIQKITTAGVLWLTLTGALYGTAGVALIALLGWLLAKLLGGERSATWAVRAFGISYSPTLVYVLCGMAANLFLGWNTAIAFGVTGVLWAMGPLIATLNDMVGGKIAAGVALATVCGGFLLFGWALLGVS